MTGRSVIMPSYHVVALVGLIYWITHVRGACSNGGGGCVTCLNSTTCQTCASGFRLSNGACVACGPNCTACSATACTSCVNGYAVSGAICAAVSCSATPTGTGKANGNCTSVPQGKFCAFSCATNFFATSTTPSGVCLAGAGPTASLVSQPNITCAQCPSCNASCTAHGSCNCGVCQCSTTNYIGVNCDTCRGNFSGSSCTTPCACDTMHGICNTTAGSSGHCLSCSASYAGRDCNITCSCVNGVCNEGITGTGTCSSCSGNYFGANCATACTCQFGACNTGPTGSGQCTSCSNSSYWGLNCAQTCTCVAGTCKSGVTGDGTCSACNLPNLFGANCDTTCTCVSGTCKNGPTGDGTCSACSSATIYGPNCDRACACQVSDGVCKGGPTGDGTCSSCNSAFKYGNLCNTTCSCQHGTCRSGPTGNGHCSSCNISSVYGQDCNLPCSCQQGTCRSGVSGDGHCTTCNISSVYGEDCDIPCSCQQGTCRGGVSGDGHCSSCTIGVSVWGMDCDQNCTCVNGVCSTNVTGSGQCLSCSAGMNVFGSNCDQPCTCVHGVCLTGVTGSGQCASCTGNFFSSNCDIACSCINGVCDNRPNGNGQCTSCTEGFYGENCDIPCTCANGVCNSLPVNTTGAGQCTTCVTGFYGLNCELPCICLAANGACDNRPSGTGLCLSCTGNTFGKTCTSPCTCSSGVCDKGPDASGHCLACTGDFYGYDCEIPCSGRCDTSAGTCNNQPSPSAGNCTACTNPLRAGELCKIDCCTGGACNNGVTGDGTCSGCDIAKQPADTFTCVDCPVGTAKDTATLVACPPCAAGKFGNATGLATCDDCPAGLFTGTTGLTICSPCPAGKSSAIGSSSCTDCEAGTYNDAPGQLCVDCVGEYFTAIAGQVQCTYCGDGGRATTQKTSCGPQQGFKPDPNAALQWLQCPVMEACCENLACGPSCDSTNSSVFYIGDLCQLCAPGAYSPNNDGRCEACPSFATVYIVVAAVALVIVCIILVIAARSASFYFGSITVAFNFFQLVSILSSYNLQWPSNVIALFNIVSVFNFNINIIHVDCLKSGGLDYVTKWKAKLVLPLVLLAIFFVIFAVATAVEAIRKRRKCACRVKRALRAELSELEGLNTDAEVHVVASIVKGENIEDGLNYAAFNAALSMMSVLYTLMITTSMEPFDCVRASTLPSALIATKDNNRFVIHAGPLVDCYGDEWKSIYKFGISGLVIYGLGVPALFAALLLKFRKSLHRDTTIALFGMLYRRYKSDNYMWELLIMLRKVALVLPVLLLSNLDGQLVIVIVAIFISAIAQVTRNPYASGSVNKLETLSIVCSFIVLVAGLVFYELGGIQGQNYLGNEQLQRIHVFLGYVIVVLISLFGVIIVIAVFADLRDLYMMKNRGAVGCYNTDQVTLHDRFFSSGMSITTAREYVTTTNHVDDIAIGYRSRKQTSFPVTLEGSLHASLTKFQYAPLIARGDSLSSYYSETDDTEKERSNSALLIQHDVVAREYHINMMFYSAGKYTLLLTGGANVDKDKNAGRCRCCKDASKHTPRYRVGKQKHCDLKSKTCNCRRAKLLEFSPDIDRRLSHMLMEYVTTITDDAGPEVLVPRSQGFVNTQKLSKVGAVLLKPTFKYLFVGQTYPFRIRVYNASAVIVTLMDADKNEIRMTRLLSENDIGRRPNALKRKIAQEKSPHHLLGLKDYQRYLDDEETDWEKKWQQQREDTERSRRIDEALRNREKGIDGRFYQVTYSGNLEISQPGFVTITIYWKGPRPDFTKFDDGEQSAEYEKAFPVDPQAFGPSKSFTKTRTKSGSVSREETDSANETKPARKHFAHVATFAAVNAIVAGPKDAWDIDASDFSEGFSESWTSNSESMLQEMGRLPGLGAAAHIAHVTSAAMRRGHP